MDDIVIERSLKFNHGKFHDRFRGSKYRGVTINGNQWQTIVNIDKVKIYMCTTNDVDKAAELYDIAII